MSKQFTVVGIGEILWDLLPEGKQMGGAPANFAYHCAVLGAKGVVASRVGNDDNGREILRRLDELKLVSDFVGVDEKCPTGTVDVSLDAQGVAEYTIHENVAWDNIPSSSELLQLAAQTDAVCFGSLSQRQQVSRDTIQAFLAATPDHCVRIFDINLRQHYFSREVIEKSLEFATVLKINDEELPVVVEMLGISGDETECVKALAERFSLDVVVLTKGGDGCYLYSCEEDTLVPGCSVEVADTVGAGDSFTAAFAMGLLASRPLARIASDASELAAYVCSHHGATPEVCDDLTARIGVGWQDC